MIYHGCIHPPRPRSAMFEWLKFYADVWSEIPEACTPWTSGKPPFRSKKPVVATKLTFRAPSEYSLMFVVGFIVS